MTCHKWLKCRWNIGLGGNSMNIKELLKSDFVILDGAMGTMLQQKGMEVGTVPETLNILKPEWIVDIHRQYIEAGSQIVYANTFGANRLKMANTDFSVAEIVEAAIKNARKAADIVYEGKTVSAAVDGANTETTAGYHAAGTSLPREIKKAAVALDMGPIGQLLEPTGSLTFEEAYDIYREIVVAGKDADLIIIETMTDLYETKAAVLAAKENSDLPVFVTMTFEENGRTFTGCSVSAMCLTLCGLGVDALGVNCSLGPKDLVPIVEEISKWSDVPIIVKPNAGLPDPVTNTYNVGPEDFANACSSMLTFGTKILGGCCGTNPSYIAALKSMLDKAISERAESDHAVISEATDNSETDTSRSLSNFAEKSHENGPKPSKIRDLAVCSPLKTVVVSEPRIIGERINPTGKKRFRQALKEEDMDYILGMAIQQVEAGADILDVNVGAPGIDEKTMMVKVIKALQSVVDVPLQIDSTKPEVLEAALRVYNGKPLVNSVNGEKAVMEKILPLVAKYGAAVVGLTLDENGIPKDADGRIAIAEKIVDSARALGIKKENIAIDCLVLTVSAEQKAAMETLKAVRWVREDLGLKNVLGVSNISFGLPNRSNINTTFLTMALSAGLDLPIMNPNLPQMMWTVKSFKVLAGHDANSLGFIEYSSGHDPIDVQLTEVKKELDEARAEITAMRSGWAEVAGYAASFAGKDNVSPAAPSARAIPSVPALNITNHPVGCMCEKCRAVNKAKEEFAARRAAESVTGGANAELAQSAGTGSIVSAGLTGSLGAGILKAMERGLKNDGRKLTGDLLKECSAMEIINDVLIPALDVIGEKFEKGKIFLPQLILAADVASECFEVIKTQIAESGESSESRGKIILATVKGDIHDIGKNIVKVILENYGYEVIDLGKDVDPSLVVKAAIEKDVHLVGLSALMTTTLGSMEETIKQLHDNNVDCKIMVGGAVLTPDYAKKIKADYYAKDAKMSADIAKEVLG